MTLVILRSSPAGSSTDVLDLPSKYRRRTLTFRTDASLAPKLIDRLDVFANGQDDALSAAVVSKAIRVKSMQRRIFHLISRLCSNPMVISAEAQILSDRELQCISLYNAPVCKHGRSHDPVQLVQGKTSPRGMIMLLARFIHTAASFSYAPVRNLQQTATLVSSAQS